MSNNNPFDELSTKLDQVLQSNLEVKNLLLATKPTPPQQEQQAKTLTFKEAVKYVDLSDSYMRYLCHKKEVPYYKPRGRRLYFKISELDDWLLQKKSEVIGDEALRIATK